MKLFGNKRGSKHTLKSKQRGAGIDSQKYGSRRDSKKKNLLVRVISIILAITATLAVILVAYWKLAVKPPDVQQEIGYEDPSGGDETQDPKKPSARTGEKYTFLILGTDDGNGNTDTMMVATLDTNDYTLNVVSIPRDTLVNVSWSIKKVNSLYGVGGIDRVLSGVSELLGYEVDHYVIVDLDAFVKLVDAIGGVYYDVPVNMNYEDSAQDLYIHFSAGPQMLSGSDAVKVVRCRSCYSDADIGRIDTQQDFLKTMAEQILQNVDKIHITTLANVFINNVDTDLKLGHVIWLAKECLKLDPENITFHKLPGNYNDWINGSYVTIYVDEWLEMINTYLNPFDEPIEESNLNILTRNSSGMLYSTSGIYAGDPSWGSYSSSYSSDDNDYDPPEPDYEPDTTVQPEPDIEDPEGTEPTPQEPEPGETDPDDPSSEEPTGEETNPNPGESGDLEMGAPEEDGSWSDQGITISG